jgi:eukaryotic-like serine/threonine-protein kinase
MNCSSCQQVVREGETFCGNCGAAVESLEATLVKPVETHNSVPEVDPLVGKVLDSKYELLEQLGQGGMGAVYKARRRHIGDEVAVKILLEKYLEGREATERFRREARAAAMLRHPNIVAIYDFSEGAGSDAPAYIVMELIDGVSLRTRLRRERKIDFDRAVAIMQGTCAGVSSAHRRGIIHRDLKPDNIIIAAPHSPGEPETVKVIDFGIAKLREVDSGASLTQTGILVGTPYYMSPEQCLGEPLDQRSDVYSLGAILYEMLDGSPPFTGPTTTSVVAKHLSEVPRSLDQQGIPAALNDVCLCALAKNPDERYQTVDDLYRSLLQASGSVKAQNRELLAAESAATVTSMSVDSATLVRGPAVGTAPTVVDHPRASAIVAPAVSTQAPVASQAGQAPQAPNPFKRIRNFAVAGGLLVLLLSVGVGFLLRWLGWTAVFMPYDEFALNLITIGLRDGIFGVLLGIALSALRRRRAIVISRTSIVTSLIVYASCGAAIAMLPFVVLRTSLFLLPLGLAIVGAVAGLVMYGVRILLWQVKGPSA